MSQSVTQNLRPEDIQEAERLELNPDMILKLIDLLFLCRDESNDIVS